MKTFAERINPSLLKAILLAGSLVGYYFLGYETSRNNFWQVFLLFAALFVFYFGLVFVLRHFGATSEAKFNWQELLIYGIAFRLLLLFMTPNLSDDYYRFYWDGTLSVNSESPYAYKPSELIDTKKGNKLGLTHEVYDNLNSKEYYTVYPPVNQIIFFLSAAGGQHSVYNTVVWMRVFLLLFEFGAMLLLFKLCRHFHVPAWKAGLYILNPLVIMEVIGNLHFEGVMIFFLLVAVLRLGQTNHLVSAANFSFAVLTKFLPLMFLPFFFKRLRYKRTLGYLTIVTLIAAPALFIAVMPHKPEGVASSFNLYFQSFEFNASVWYIVRAIGYWAVDYNILQAAGPWLAFAAFIVIVTMAITERRGNKEAIFTTFLLCLTVYYLSSPIVHPWYIAPLVAFSVFSHYRFALIWSFMVVLSYWAYSNPGYSENYWLIGIEYGVVLSYLAWELRRSWRARIAAN